MDPGLHRDDSIGCGRCLDQNSPNNAVVAGAQGAHLRLSLRSLQRALSGAEAFQSASIAPSQWHLALQSSRPDERSASQARLGGIYLSYRGDSDGWGEEQWGDSYSIIRNVLCPLKMQR